MNRSVTMPYSLSKCAGCLVNSSLIFFSCSMISCYKKALNCRAGFHRKTEDSLFTLIAPQIEITTTRKQWKLISFLQADKKSDESPKFKKCLKKLSKKTTNIFRRLSRFAYVHFAENKRIRFTANVEIASK